MTRGAEPAGPLTAEERAGLTFHGRAINAQIRFHGHAERPHLVLYVNPAAPQSAEDGEPVFIAEDDAAKLRALLNEAARRASAAGDAR